MNASAQVTKDTKSTRYDGYNRYSGYNRPTSETKSAGGSTKHIQVAIIIGTPVSVTEVTVNSETRTLTVWASDVFGPLNAKRSYPTHRGYWPKSFTMTTQKGIWQFSDWAMPEYYDGQACTYTTKIVSPDGSEVVWTMVVYND